MRISSLSNSLLGHSKTKFSTYPGCHSGDCLVPFERGAGCHFGACIKMTLWNCISVHLIRNFSPSLSLVLNPQNLANSWKYKKNPALTIKLPLYFFGAVYRLCMESAPRHSKRSVLQASHRGSNPLHQTEKVQQPWGLLDFFIALAQKTTGYAGENKRLIVQKTSFWIRIYTGSPTVYKWLCKVNMKE